MQTPIEAVKAAVQGMTEAEGGAAVTTSTSTRICGPPCSQTTFNWKAQEKYNELLNFEMEVKNIFMTKSYTLMIVQVPVIINLQGCEGLHTMQTLTKEQQEMHKTVHASSLYYNAKFKSWHNKAITLITTILQV